MNESVKQTLARLQKANLGNRKPSGSSTEKVPYYKMKAGKNNLMLIELPEVGDPFMLWAGHKNLLDQEWMEVPCDLFNFNKECLICQTVDDLKRADFKGNLPLWKPLEQKTRNYSWVIDLDDVSKGPQLWGYGKSVSVQFETWIANLEEDETPFYLKDKPEKIVVQYDKDKPAMEMYKLDKKVLKAFPSAQYEEWQGLIKPVGELFKNYSKNQEEQSDLIERYMERIQEELSNQKEGDAPLAAQPSKLNKLKE